MNFNFPTTTVTTSKPDSCSQDGDFNTQMLILAGVALLLGLSMCFFGYKLFKFILFLTGFFVGFFATYALCSLYLEEKLHGDAREHKDQIYLGLSIGSGIIVGFLTLCLYYVGLFVLGATMGWFIGMSILPFLKSQASFFASNMWLPYSVCAGCAVFAGLVMLCIQRTIIILSTAFLGALLVINGLDYYVEKGRVVNYTVQILQGNHIYLPNCWYTWVVLGFLPILFIIGVIVQHVKTSKGVDHRLASGRVLVVDAHQMYEVAPDDEFARPLLSEHA